MLNSHQTSTRTRRGSRRTLIGAGAVLTAVSLSAAFGQAPMSSATESMLATTAITPEASATYASIAKRMEFLEGTWIGTMGSDTVEETWSGPNGTHLMGMFRWTDKQGNVTLMELMSIELEETGFVLYLRHFDGALVPWKSEKDGPQKFRLAKMERNERVRWVPEDEASDLQSLTYHRYEQDKMSIKIEFDDGLEREPLAFEMKLKKGESGWKAHE